MITLFYQTESKNFFIPNSIPTHLRTEDSYDFKSVKPKFIVEICNYLNIPIKQVNKQTWQGETAYYHIELEWIDQAMIYRNVFEWIDADVLDLIKDKEKKLRLLLWFPNEGFSLSMPRFMDIIDFCIKDLNIPPEKVYFVFGDVNIDKNYKYWTDKKGYSSINVYGFDSFESTYHNECRILERHGYKNIFPREEDRIKNLNKNRNKRFIFRNANPRNHRLYFAAELKRKNILDKSYYTWLNRYCVPNDGIFKWIIKQYVTEITQISRLTGHMKEFIDASPYVLDYTAENIGEGLNQRILDPEIFSDSYFTFVTETTYDNTDNENVLFLTEKIYQPIVQYHPFIVAACPGILAYMRKHGYQTFPELFDESYDQEQDLKKRTKMILDNIERVTTMPVEELHSIYYSDSFQKKLVHNKNLFVTGKGKQKWEDAIKWLAR
jgi:hypothetical protein